MLVVGATGEMGRVVVRKLLLRGEYVSVHVAGYSRPLLGIDLAVVCHIPEGQKLFDTWAHRDGTCRLCHG